MSDLLLPMYKSSYGVMVPHPNWTKYYGCNTNKLDLSKDKRFTKFKFSDFINKPLSNKLWEIIHIAIRPNELWILTPDSPVLTIGRLTNYMDIYVDSFTNPIILDVALNKC